MRKIALPLFLALVGGCRDMLPTGLAPDQPLAAISDQAHSGGRKGFYWLPPMVRATSHTGTFDPSLAPVVEVCEWNGTACVQPLLASFSTSGSGAERVRVDLEDEHYIVNWKTAEHKLSTNKVYRIRVTVVGTELGFADAKLVRGDDDEDDDDKRSTSTPQEFVALRKGETLPIKFRIEEGAVFVLASQGGTVKAADGAVALVFPEGALTSAIGVTVEPAVIPADDANAVPGAVYEFKPSPYTFEERVKLTVRYDETRLPPGVSENQLRLRKRVNGVWQTTEESTVNTAENTVTGYTWTFSEIGAVAATEPSFAGTWTVEQQGLTGDWLHGVWGPSANDLFAVGGIGQILRYNGSSWSRVHLRVSGGPSPELRAIWGTSGTNVYAVGRRGAIFHFDGTNWSQQTSNAPMNPQWNQPVTLNAVWGTSTGTVYAVGEMGVILRNTGTGWEQMPSNAPPAYYGPAELTAIWGTADNNIYAVGQNAAVLHFDGNVWTSISSFPYLGESFYGIWGTSATNIYAASHQSLLHYNGSSWTQIPLNLPPTESGGGTTQLRGVWGTSASDVWAVGQNGTIVHFDGTSWSLMASGSSQFLSGVFGTASNNVVAVGDAGTILRWNGSAWSVESFGPRLEDVWGTSDTNVYAVGQGGTILRNAGTGWTQVSSGTTEWVAGISGTGASNVYAATYGGSVMRYDGTKWSRVYGGPGSGVHQLQDVWASTDNHVFAVGANGTIHRFDGTSWSPMISNAPVTQWGTVMLQAVWGTSSTNVYAVGDFGTILHYNGTSWSQMTSNAPTTSWGAVVGLREIWGTSATDVYAVGDNGTVLRYDGSNWSQVSTGTTTGFSSVWGTSASNIYAVGQGQVWRYDGTSWTQLKNMWGPNMPQLFGVWGSSASNVYAVGGPGLIVRGTP